MTENQGGAPLVKTSVKVMMTPARGDRKKGFGSGETGWVLSREFGSSVEALLEGDGLWG